MLNNATPEPPDMFFEAALKLRLEAIRDAQSRTRKVFAIISIVCGALLIAVYNECLSWTRSYPLDFKTSVTYPDGVGEAQKEAIREWVQSVSVSNSLLGIHLQVSDAATIGSLLLLILCIWFFFSIRKDYQIIEALLYDTLNLSKTIRLGIFHIITSYTLFTTTSGRFKPIKKLGKRQAITKDREDRFNVWRFIFHLLLFLPPLTIAAIIASDLHTFYGLSAILRGSKLPIVATLTAQRRAEVEPLVWWFDGVGIFLLLLSIIVCVQVTRFESATREMLRDYYAHAR